MTARPTTLVTGAASGIGKRTAAALADEGHRIIGVDRYAMPDVDVSVVADLSREEGVAQVVGAVDEELDALCNIAGVPGTADPDYLMRVNVNAVRGLSDGLQPHLKYGSTIINLASLAGAGWRGRVDLIHEYLSVAPHETKRWLAEHADIAADAYAFSKECVIVASAMAAAQLVSSGIRVVSVSPGPVDTPILGDFIATLGDRVTTGIKVLGRAGSTDDVAGVIRFLLSGTGTWVNGTDLVVDGGLGAWRSYAASRRDGS